MFKMGLAVARAIGLALSCALGLGVSTTAHSEGLQEQDAKQIVRQAVGAELAADRNDHSRWLYLEVDRKPKDGVTQWVAETSQGSLKRILTQNGQTRSAAQQKKAMDGFVSDGSAQARQRKSDRHDDNEAANMLKLLPNAFVWSETGIQGGNTSLHFRPDPNFRPPDREATVFAAMEGDMEVDNAQHRIVSLKGRLTRDVKFGGGFFAELKAGGSFDVERREIGPGIWQITETHVHIQGHALLFKSISEQEDDRKSKFKQLPGDLTLQQAENSLLQETT